MTPDTGITAVQFRHVLEVVRMLAVTTELPPLLQHIAEATCELLACERASIFLYDKRTDELCTHVALGTSEIRIGADTGIAGSAFRGNVVTHVKNAYADDRFNRSHDEQSGFVTHNLLAAPMTDLSGTPVGVLQAVNKRVADFSAADLALVRLLADQAAVAVQRFHLQQDAVRAQGLRHEMRLAREVQEATIPKASPAVTGLTAAGWKKPASETSGDCFDLWTLPDGRLGVILMDASGHGLAPTLVVSQARTLLRGLAEIDPDPHRLLARVNRRMVSDMVWGRFVTAFVGFFAPDGLVEWASAGHGPLFFRPEADGLVVTMSPTTPPLGVTDEWDAGASVFTSLAPGGSITIISDGIFEAANMAGEMFGVKRVCDLLDLHPSAEPHAVVELLARAATIWHGDEEPRDDQTIVVVRRSAE